MQQVQRRIPFAAMSVAITTLLAVAPVAADSPCTPRNLKAWIVDECGDINRDGVVDQKDLATLVDWKCMHPLNNCDNTNRTPVTPPARGTPAYFRAGVDGIGVDHAGSGLEYALAVCEADPACQAELFSCYETPVVLHWEADPTCTDRKYFHAAAYDEHGSELRPIGGAKSLYCDATTSDRKIGCTTNGDCMGIYFGDCTTQICAGSRYPCNDDADCSGTCESGTCVGGSRFGAACGSTVDCVDSCIAAPHPRCDDGKTSCSSDAACPTDGTCEERTTSVCDDGYTPCSTTQPCATGPCRTVFFEKQREWYRPPESGEIATFEVQAKNELDQTLDLPASAIQYEPGPLGVATKDVMEIGDSITEGHSHAYGAVSYRRPLFYMLDKTLYIDVTDSGGSLIPDTDRQLNFVGSDDQLRWGGYHSCDTAHHLDKDHEGHWGETASWFVGQLPGFLAGQNPQVALVHLGTNDINQDESGDPPGAMADRVRDSLRLIIETLQSHNSEIKILLAQIIPLRDHLADDKGEAIRKLRDKIMVLAGEKTTLASPVVVVDQYSTMFDASGYRSDYMIDAWHPNYWGEEQMAGEWFRALTGRQPPALAVWEPCPELIPDPGYFE